MVVAILISAIAGVAFEYYYMRGVQSSTLPQKVSTTTVFKTRNFTTTIAVVQVVTSKATVTSVSYDPLIPSYTQINGTVESQTYLPIDIYFEHCLPEAFVECNSYSSNITLVTNSTRLFGNETYSFFTGVYSVVLPNNSTYGVSVRLADGSNSNGTYLTALAVLPLYAITPLVGNYNIDCYFPGANTDISNIACASS